MGEEPCALAVILGLIILAHYVFIWSISLLGLSQAKHLFGRKSPYKDAFPASSSPLTLPGISILRPLAGLDHNLALNLTSSFEQVYPPEKFEVILSVRDEWDQALAVAKEVCARYPHIQSRILVGEETCGVNPKVANLVRPYAIAKNDLIWVLDSQCSLPPHALFRAVHSFTSPPPTPSPQILGRRPHGSPSVHVGLAHHVPLGVSPRASIGSFVEATFLGGNHAKMYLAINSLAIDSCVIGKSNMWRKSDLEKVPDSFFDVGKYGTRGEKGAIGSTAFGGGEEEGREDVAVDSNHELVSKTKSRALARFSIYLAEDNMLALALWRPPLFLPHVLLPSDVVHCSVSDIGSLRDYAERRMRWIRVRKHMVRAATYLEPLTESLVVGILACWALIQVWLPFFVGTGDPWPMLPTIAIFCFVHFTLWHLVDFEVFKTLQETNCLPRQPNESFLGARNRVESSAMIDWSNKEMVWKLRLAWILRELLAFPIWAWAIVGSTVIWRGRKYRILADARAAHLDTSTSTSTSILSLFTTIPKALLVGLYQVWTSDFSQKTPRSRDYEPLQRSSEQFPP